MGGPKQLRANTRQRAGVLVFAVIWTAFTVVWEVSAWASGAPIFFLLFGLPFIAVGIGMLAWGLKPIIAGVNVGRADVQVSSDPVRVGESFSFSYQQPFKRDVEVNRASITFVLRESATYRRGTDTTTVTHEHAVDSAEYPSGRYMAGQVFGEQRTLRVPDNSIHTFSAQRNKLQWFIKVHLDIAGWPDVQDEYEITVLPERAR